MKENKTMRFEIELPENYDDIISITAIGSKAEVTNVLCNSIEVRGHNGELLIIPEKDRARWETPITLDKTVEEAYMNYQDTGYRRYETAQIKHEDWADTLNAVLYSASNARVARMLKTNVRAWATTIENLKDKTDEAKQEEIEKLLEEIRTTEKLLKHM